MRAGAIFLRQASADPEAQVRREGNIFFRHACLFENRIFFEVALHLFLSFLSALLYYSNHVALHLSVCPSRYFCFRITVCSILVFSLFTLTLDISVYFVPGVLFAPGRVGQPRSIRSPAPGYPRRGLCVSEQIAEDDYLKPGHGATGKVNRCLPVSPFWVGCCFGAVAACPMCCSRCVVYVACPCWCFVFFFCQFIDPCGAVMLLPSHRLKCNPCTWLPPELAAKQFGLRYVSCAFCCTVQPWPRLHVMLANVC